MPSSYKLRKVPTRRPPKNRKKAARVAARAPSNRPQKKPFRKQAAQSFVKGVRDTVGGTVKGIGIIGKYLAKQYRIKK